MKLDTLAKIFELFFGKCEFQVITDNLRMKICTIEYTVKNVVEYSREENNLNIYTIDLETDELYKSIIEGSPEDIIKLSKILEQ